MGNGEWGMGNGEWGMGNGEWEIEKWENKKISKNWKKHEIVILYK